MSKCERCGSGRMSWWSGAIKFKDGKYICVKCLKELGREHPLKDAYYLKLHTSEEILHPEIKWEKQRQEEFEVNSLKLGISPSQYEALENANATDFEMKLFSRICLLLDDEGVSSCDLVVSSGTNGSLLIMKDGEVVIEYKGKPDLKWIMLSDDPDNKIRFGQLSKLNSLADRIISIVGQ